MDRAVSCAALRARQRAAEFGRNARGSVAVESAIVVPAFLLFIFTLIETSVLCWTQVSLQFSVESAARCAAVNSTTCGSTSAVQTYAAGQMFGLSVPSSDFTVTQPSCGHKVVATYPFNFGLPFVYSKTINLAAQSCHP